MPDREWQVSGVVIKGNGAGQSTPPPVQLPPATRPKLAHSAPPSVEEGKPLSVKLEISGDNNIQTVRLHYRPVNQLANFQSLDAAPGGQFTIPGKDIDAGWDLMYYFEILNKDGIGWFAPDPLQETPYYVVKVRPAVH